MTRARRVKLMPWPAIAYLILLAAAPFVDAGSLWGIDHLRYYPASVAAIAPLLALGLALAGLKAGSPAACVREEAAEGRWRRGVPVVLCAGFGALFLALRSKTALLGDGMLRLRVLPLSESAGMPQVCHEPLAFAAARGMLTVVRGQSDPAAGAFCLMAIAGGVLYVALAWALAAQFARSAKGRFGALLLLLTPGLMQLFFGYIETYAIATAAIALYALVGCLVLAGRLAAWAPALLLGLIAPLHFGLLTLGPSAAVAAWSGGAAAPSIGRRRAWPAFARATLACALATAAFCAVMAWLHVDLARYLSGLRGDHLLPPGGALSNRQAYHLFSAAHAVDLLNVLALTVPSALLLAPVLAGVSWRADPVGRFLGSFALFPLVAAVLINPEIGAFRDWDLLAMLLTPLAIALAWASARRIERRPRALLAIVSVAAASAFSALIWVGVNARPGAAEARYRRCLETGSLSVHGRAYGWETLGDHLAARGAPPPEVAAAFERAISADPYNPRYWNLAGLHLAAAERLDEAAEHLERSVSLRPETNPENFNNLGTVYQRMGRREDAVRCFRRAVELKPDFVAALRNLGRTLIELGAAREAESVLRDLVRLHPDFAAAQADLGLAIHLQGRTRESIELLEKAAAKAPRDPDLLFNLAAVHQAQGDTATAVRYLRRLIEANPAHPLANRAREWLAGSRWSDPLPAPRSAPRKI